MLAISIPRMRGKDTGTADWTLNPPDAQVQAEELRAAFPTYRVSLVVHGDRTRFEAISTDGGNPWCLISADPREICRALKPAASADTQDR